MSTTWSAADLPWLKVPGEICRLAKSAAGPYQVIRDLVPSLPDLNVCLWYNPDAERVYISHREADADSEKQASWYIALRQVPGVEGIVQSYFTKPPADEPYMPVKLADGMAGVLKTLGSVAQFEPNALNKLWGGPNPLAATIGGGLLGAGLGYGGGWLAEQVLPDEYFEPKVLRKNTARIGAMMGAAPGVWAGFDQQFRGPNPGWGAWVRPFPWHDTSINRFEPIKQGLAKVLPEGACELNALWEKAADEAGGEFAQTIPVDQFGRTIWNDLRSQGGYTPPALAAATTGLVQAASMSQGGLNMVSPIDIARIGIGMGSGYLSGLLVGKTLGALAGLRPEAQQVLQQTGVWAGVLANTVPLAFR